MKSCFMYESHVIKQKQNEKRLIAIVKMHCAKTVDLNADVLVQKTLKLSPTYICTSKNFRGVIAGTPFKWKVRGDG